MSRNHASSVLALWLGINLSAVSWAEEINYLENPVVVTASRTDQAAEDTLASVTVITRTDIERQQARSVQDLLHGIAGINVANTGGPGKLTTLFLRGTESDHVLVLVDGIRMGSATSGFSEIQNYPVELIDRIEIVRGPRSSLYGPEAVGGVIQIFTRKSGKKGLKPTLSFGGGSYGTINGSATLSGSSEHAWFNLGISGSDTNGFNACKGSFSAGCFTVEPDKDGYRNISGSARAGYHFDSGLDVEASFLHTDGHYEYDGGFINRTKLAQQMFGGTARYSPFEPWRITLTMGRSNEDSDNFKEKMFMTRYHARRDTISWQNDITVTPNQLLTIGTDYLYDHVNSTEKFTTTSRYNWGVFAQHQISLAAHKLQLSLRHDDNQQFGSQVTGGASWGYSLTERVRLTAGFGSAFKAPTFNELYFPGFGNPHLKPEDAHTVELGATGRFDRGNWSLNLYETWIDNLISYNAATFAPDNIDKARIQGLEAILNTEIKGWLIQTNLTFLNPENRSKGANRGNILPRRSKQAFRIDASRQLGNFVVGALFLAEANRYDDLANKQQLDDYVKVDLRAEYLINSQWRIQGRVENLFDKDYETAAFFNQPGRSFFATLRYQP
ncbi:TonB-dependent vitamin B12 receptor [Nitrosomonas eutropha]|uniref:Vitamin B12 transporter n=2 Tax=Nitrosomonas eutropha TaxID=916 RepID=A0ABX5M847_9PROT|nr:TonB-dependent vitamin B12 receptor [Nitrosomonas eutropha]ABI60148.1 TonB-dependent vitamin B12 receptor [Nitrosomonas eutropha C91]PXV77570.1 vitamin B12 transporter [Nitrosomonas eutropha]